MSTDSVPYATPLGDRCARCVESSSSGEVDSGCLILYLIWPIWPHHTQIQFLFICPCLPQALNWCFI